jgi:hypothetical protein
MWLDFFFLQSHPSSSLTVGEHPTATKLAQSAVGDGTDDDMVAFLDTSHGWSDFLDNTDAFVSQDFLLVIPDKDGFF